MLSPADAAPLSAADLEQWERDGFVVMKGLLPFVLTGAMLDRAVELTRHEDEHGRLPGHGLLLPEANPGPAAEDPEDRASKI
ncbi:MAG: hypothetical protein AAGK32_09155, partial [Actinomycetota bacterium]